MKADADNSRTSQGTEQTGTEPKEHEEAHSASHTISEDDKNVALQKLPQSNEVIDKHPTGLKGDVLEVTVESTKDFDLCKHPFVELCFSEQTKRIVNLARLLENQQIPPKADADFHDLVTFAVHDRTRALVVVIKDSSKPSKPVGTSKIPIETLQRNQKVSAWCKVYKRTKKQSVGAVLLSLLLKECK